MSHRTLTAICFFLGLMIPGVGTAQDSVPVARADSSAPATALPDGGENAPSPFKVETWVAVRPDVKLNDGKKDVEAHTYPRFSTSKRPTCRPHRRVTGSQATYPAGPWPPIYCRRRTPSKTWLT